MSVAPALHTDIGLYVGLGAAFLASGLLAVVFLPRGRDRATELGSALQPYVATPGRVGRPARAVFEAVVARFTQILDRIPRPRGYDGTVERSLELAGWPLRSAEFLAARFGAALVAATLGYTITGRWWFAAGLGAGGWFVPKLLLRQGVDKRVEAFRTQLPDTLQLLAASLEAGYGLMQGLDAVMQEAPQPTSSEFARALTQIRLGMPVSEALDNLADRIGGEEFRWIVLAVNVQRETGGNLSSILLTIADTLREREQLGRQVKVLSAEGRISGIILTFLPIALAAYMAVVNPTYLGAMFLTQTGRILLLIAVGLLVAGGVWMRRLVRIEV